MNPGTYRNTNATTTAAKLHLSHPLCRRMPSSIVMDMIVAVASDFCHPPIRTGEP